MLTLGTAQIGLPQYGRTNATAFPTEDDAIALIHAAIAGGVHYIDCARAYGLAEERVGKAVVSGFTSRLPGAKKNSDNCGLNSRPTIITKLSPLAWLRNDAEEETVRAAVEASVYQSCHNLRLQTLSVLMLHRWTHHDSHGGQVWKILQELKEKGVIEALGASVYTPEEAIEAMADPAVAHLQIPFNLLDHRWLAPAFQAAKSKQPDVMIHVRSAYLQGILLVDPEAWPTKEKFDAAPICEALDRLVQDLGRQSRADLCLAYLNSCPFVDSVLVGVDTIKQLQENLQLFRKRPLTSEERELVESRIIAVPNWLLNPIEW